MTYMYSAFTHFTGALDMVSAYTMAFGGICASATLHLELINNTLRGPLLFFERTPLGRILNRFTEDMATIDFVMPFTIRSMINCVLQMTGTLCVIGVNTAGQGEALWCSMPCHSASPCPAVLWCTGTTGSPS